MSEKNMINDNDTVEGRIVLCGANSYDQKYYFNPKFRGVVLNTKMRVDFFVKDKVFVECKAINEIGVHERLQLWAYMRAAKIRIGILYNFLPVMDECEKYYYDPEDDSIGYF